jgi:predicted MFS family arabinose efflux permease
VLSKMGASSSQPGWSFKDIPDLTGFRVLVTGGNAGIGKAAVENFIQFSNCEKVIIIAPALVACTVGWIPLCRHRKTTYLTVVILWHPTSMMKFVGCP